MPDAKKLLQALEARFTRNMPRHPGMKWPSVIERIDGNAKALKALAEMESSGGEPGLERRSHAGCENISQVAFRTTG